MNPNPPVAGAVAPNAELDPNEKPVDWAVVAGVAPAAPKGLTAATAGAAGVEKGLAVAPKPPNVPLGAAAGCPNRPVEGGEVACENSPVLGATFENSDGAEVAAGVDPKTGADWPNAKLGADVVTVVPNPKAGAA